MDAESLAEALRRMTPDNLAVVEGCVLWPEDNPPSAERVRSHLGQLRANYGSITPAPPPQHPEPTCASSSTTR